jgi:hypothetical protein
MAGLALTGAWSVMRQARCELAAAESGTGATVDTIGRPSPP